MKNLKNIKKGDLSFFYQSNIGKEVLGIAKDIKEFYSDKSDKSGRFVAVTVHIKKKFFKPVTLKSIIKNKELRAIYQDKTLHQNQRNLKNIPFVLISY